MNESDDIRRRLLLAGAGGLAALLDLADVDAQDPAKVMPKSYRVVFENDRVRVLEFSGRPGMGICGEGTHSHPAHLTIAMSAWQARARHNRAEDAARKIQSRFDRRRPSCSGENCRDSQSPDRPPRS